MQPLEITNPHDKGVFDEIEEERPVCVSCKLRYAEYSFNEKTLCDTCFDNEVFATLDITTIESLTENDYKL